MVRNPLLASEDSTDDALCVVTIVHRVVRRTGLRSALLPISDHEAKYLRKCVNPPLRPAPRLTRASRRPRWTRAVRNGVYGRRLLPLRPRVRPLAFSHTLGWTDEVCDGGSERQRVLIAEKKEQLLRMRIRDAKLNEGAAEPAHH